ncbi:hypothetical protein B566_EDAN005859 [Ephemera danica]|nr:hypothetical protein B566_EDAN005859 [Ephemera danica]
MERRKVIFMLKCPEEKNIFDFGECTVTLQEGTGKLSDGVEPQDGAPARIQPENRVCVHLAVLPIPRPQSGRQFRASVHQQCVSTCGIK